MFGKYFMPERHLKSRPSTRRKNRRPSSEIDVEFLERRELMASRLTASLASGILRIEGTELADVIKVRQRNNLLTVDGVAIAVDRSRVSSVSGPLVSRIEVRGLGGNDLVDLNTSAIPGNQSILIPTIINGGTGNDLLGGGEGNDTLEGGEGSDVLLGNLGNDNYVFRAASAEEVDYVNDGYSQGWDRLDFSALAANDPVTVDLQSRLAIYSAPNSTPLAQHSNRTVLRAPFAEIRSVVGGAGNDSLRASETGSRLVGGGGNDSLTGGVGPDIMQGDTGHDVLSAGYGNDTLVGGAGSDWLFGGAGDDTYVFHVALASELDTVYDGDGEGRDCLDFNTLGSADALAIDLQVRIDPYANAVLPNMAPLAQHRNRAVLRVPFSALECALGGEGSDSIRANEGGGLLVGGAGNDSLTGGVGPDVLQGGAGSDVFRTIGAGDRIADSNQTASREISGLFYDKWKQLGGLSNTTLGLPIGPELAGAVLGVRYQHFERAILVYQPSRGISVVHRSTLDDSPAFGLTGVISDSVGGLINWVEDSTGIDLDGVTKKLEELDAQGLKQLTEHLRGQVSDYFVAESDMEQVRQQIVDGQGGSWFPVYGTMIDEKEWGILMGSVAASVALENPGPVMKYFEGLIKRNIQEMQRALKGVATSAIQAALERVIKGNGKVVERIANGPLEIKAGIATYHRTMFGGVELLNHHQFYIAFRFYEPGTNNIIRPDGSVSIPAVQSLFQPAPSRPAYEIVLVNKDSVSKEVNFSWGKGYASETYYLAPYESKALVMLAVYGQKPVSPAVSIQWTDGVLSGGGGHAAVTVFKSTEATFRRYWDGRQYNWPVPEGKTMVSPFDLLTLSGLANNPKDPAVWIV